MPKKSLEDLPRLLLQLSADGPQARARLADGLRATLALLAQDAGASGLTGIVTPPPPQPVVEFTAPARKAMEELAATLSMAAEHAEALAVQTWFTARRPHV